MPGGNDDGGSLWIDYLLLPSKLDDHLAALAAGTASKPSHLDLITMFLEQALLCFKSAPASNKMDIAIAVSNAEGKPATLCFLAAKAGMASNVTLEDIESISSPQHQLLFLRALIKYDKTNSLVRQCDLHRWVIRNTIKSQSARIIPNRKPNNALQPSSASADDSYVISVGETGDVPAGAENDSITFIETVLGCLQDSPANSGQDNEPVLETVTADLHDKISGIIALNPSDLTKLYECQLLMDLGEVNFMRGRISKAHSFFSKCGEKLEHTNMSSCGQLNTNFRSPISSKLLSGFIIACRMILAMQMLISENKSNLELLQELGMKHPPLPLLDSPSAMDGALIVCEQSRWLISRKLLQKKQVNSDQSENATLGLSSLGAQDSQILDDLSFVSKLLQIDQISSGTDNFDDIINKADGIFKVLTRFITVKHNQGGPTESELPTSSSEELLILEEISKKCLVDTFAHDFTGRHLTWSYRFSLEKDLSIPSSVRSYLEGCNVLQSIFAGSPLESFLRVGVHLENKSEAVGFLLRIIAAYLRNKEDDTFPLHAAKKMKPHEGHSPRKEDIVSHLDRFVKYICCVIDKSWCWELAYDLHLMTKKDIQKLRGSTFGLRFGDELQTFGGLQSMRSGNKDSRVLLKLLETDTVCDDKTFFQKLGTLSKEFEPISSNHVHKLDYEAKAVVTITIQKAFEALKHGKQYELSRCLYSQASVLDSENCDCQLMQWLLSKLSKDKEKADTNSLESIKIHTESFPTYKALIFTFQKLIDEDLWENLQQFCTWLCSFSNEGFLDSINGNEKLKRRAKKMTLLGKVGINLGKLFTFYFSSKSSISSKDIGPSMLGLLEEFLCQLFDVDRICGDMPKFQNTTSMLPVILNISNSKVITCIATLAAGWLQRCYLAGATAFPVDVDRYGPFARLIAGSVITSSMGPSPNSSQRNVSFRLSPDTVKFLFRKLLERYIDLPDDMETDAGGYCWLQGLADLAFEEQDHSRALQYYLQAGAIRTACYSDHTSPMPRNIFTPWIVSRMISSCRALAAALQGAILCQCLPVPDFSLAFQILQENMGGTEKDLLLYSDCIWELPILEFLIHIYSKSGDEAHVNLLVSVLQQPALNVHNPSNIRKCHIQAMEQCFLQRFYDDIVMSGGGTKMR